MRSVPSRRAQRITSLAIVTAVLAACGGDSTGTGGTTVASVTVSPTTLNLHPGQNGTLTATALSSSGAVLTGKAFAWQSSNTSVATVSASGVVTALTPGNATISVTSEAYSANATVNVTPVAQGSSLTPQAVKSP
jgi:uncharacterized protein YjdB